MAWIHFGCAERFAIGVRDGATRCCSLRFLSFSSRFCVLRLVRVDACVCSSGRVSVSFGKGKNGVFAGGLGLPSLRGVALVQELCPRELFDFRPRLSSSRVIAFFAFCVPFRFVHVHLRILSAWGILVNLRLRNTGKLHVSKDLHTTWSSFVSLWIRKTWLFIVGSRVCFSWSCSGGTKLFSGWLCSFRSGFGHGWCFAGAQGHCTPRFVAVILWLFSAGLHIVCV